MIQGDPPQLDFCLNYFSGFEHLITLSVILRHIEAEVHVIILSCIKVPPIFFFFQENNIFFTPQINFWRALEEQFPMVP
jgi:hypothetical protein